MVDDLAKRLVSDGLWEIVEPLIPEAPTGRKVVGGPVWRTGRCFPRARGYPQAIVFVLTSGCAWRHLPPSFGVTHPTAHRRFQEWSRAGLWARLHREVLDRLGAAGDIDWTRAVVHAASVPTRRGRGPG